MTHAVAVGKTEVEHGHVDVVEHLARLRQRRRLADHVKAGLPLKRRRDRLAHGGVVLHEQNTHLVGCHSCRRR